MIETLQAEAGRILKEHRVDVVIGFQAGTLPLISRPVFIRHPESADKLVYNGFCQSNLAAYIPQRPGIERIGLVCRGCESRAINVLVGEKQYDRELLYLIGVPCRGVIDRRKIESKAGGNVLSAGEIGNNVVVRTRDRGYRFERETVLCGSCSNCRFQNPVGVDVMIGNVHRQSHAGDAYSAVESFESLSDEERYEFFSKEAERCIRCYACRGACPMCYCIRCFADCTTPRWTESTVAPAGTQAWHIMRAFHQAGRCVACGACERACPMDIRMTYLTDKLNRDMNRVYGFVPGLDDAGKPPFVTFSQDDAGRFES